jgi:tetratricopeptide (TPR) repeat protein
MLDETPERERNLKERIRVGTAQMQDYVELADIYYLTGRLDDTLAILKEATSLDLAPCQRASLLNEQAQFVFLITGAKDEALALAEQAILILRQHPPTPDTALAEISAETLVAKVLWDSNRSQAVQAASRALSRIQRATNDTPQFDAETFSAMCISASQLHVLTGHLEDAIEWARRALVQPLDEYQRIPALVELGYLLSRSGKSEEAGEVLRTALNSAKSRGRQNPRIYHELGLVQLALGRPREAVEYFEQALQIIKSDKYLRRDRDYVSTLNMGIASAFYELGEHRAEAEVYRKILRTLGENEPNYWICRLSLAQCDIGLKNFEDARENLEGIIKSEPSATVRDSARGDLLSLRYTIAFRDYEARDHESSIAHLESLLTESIVDDNLRSDVLLLLGHACVGTRHFSQARACYEELINSASASQYHRDAAASSLVRLSDGRFPEGVLSTSQPKRAN